MNDNQCPKLANEKHQKLVSELFEAQAFVQREEATGRMSYDPSLSTLYGRALAEIAEMSEQIHGLERASWS